MFIRPLAQRSPSPSWAEFLNATPVSVVSLRPPIATIFCSSSCGLRTSSLKMGGESLSLIQNGEKLKYRNANVSGYKTDILEITAPNPAFHVLFVPGNPGVISFNTNFLETLYGLLGGTASVTAIGHISHSEKNWEPGKLFSIQDQINHKASFIEQEYEAAEAPLVLVGHSIGAYICLESFKRYQDKISYCICLHPFLALNTASSTQASIGRLARSTALSIGLSYVGALLGMLPSPVSRFLVKNSVGKEWSSPAVEALCTHGLKYHTLRNMLFMAKTEFETLPGKPELDFIRERKSQMAFLFGMDDHWAPLHVHDEIRKEVIGVRLEVEEDGHPHAFCCTEAGSLAIAKRVSIFIHSFFPESRTDST